MKLWEFLRQNLKKDRVEQVEVLAKNYNFKNKLVATTKVKKYDQAMEILSILASNNVAVPLCDNYGEKLKDKILRDVSNNKNIYPDLAFVMYTSGTTGEPKGVMLTNENIIENIKAIDNYFKVENGQKILISRPLIHISAITGELLFGLYKGLEIDFYDEEFQAKRLASYIDNNKIEIFCAAPTVFYHLSNYLIGKSLKTVALSGERLNEKIINVLKEKYSLIDFYNVYGLTENSPRVSVLLPNEFFKKATSVGRPILNTQVKVEDGELLVKSKSIMQGYLNNEKLTKDKIKDGYLHTGDMAKIDDEGFIYILGRKDEMIIRSGVNIYPAEIENIVNSINGVENCLVYGEEDINYGQKICLKVAGKIELKSLRTQLLQKLHPHLMPSKIEIVDTLPTTITGKVKRK